MSKTVAALYESLDQARGLVKALVDAGFEREKISLVASDPEGGHGEVIAARTEGEEEGRREATADGAIMGGAIGAIAGLLFGLSAFTIPGLGPLIIAGPIYTTVFGAGAGGLSGGLIGALVEAGIPEEEAAYYREGIRRGHTLVTLEVNEEEQARAVHILRAHDPVEMESTTEKWRDSGPSGPGKTPDSFVPSAEDEEEAREHKYATGAMGVDMTGRRASRDRPPLPTYPDEEEDDR